MDFYILKKVCLVGMVVSGGLKGESFYQYLKPIEHRALLFARDHVVPALPHFIFPTIAATVCHGGALIAQKVSRALPDLLRFDEFVPDARVIFFGILVYELYCSLWQRMLKDIAKVKVLQFVMESEHAHSQQDLRDEFDSRFKELQQRYDMLNNSLKVKHTKVCNK